MKKLLLSAALVAATSSFATVEDSFYLTGAVGMSKPSKYTVEGDKFKPNNAFVGEIGAGYNITDSTRAELVFTRQFDSKSKAKDVVDVHNIIPGTRAGQANLDTNIKRSINANAIMARVTQDVYDYGVGKVFLTGGLGIARVQEKISATVTSPLDTGDVNKVTLKSKNNVAFSIAAGSSFEVQENVMIDLSVGYTDFGKVKSKKVKGRDLFDANSTSTTVQLLNARKGNRNITVSGKNLRAFSIKAGVRVNL